MSCNYRKKQKKDSLKVVERRFTTHPYFLFVYHCTLYVLCTQQPMSVALHHVSMGACVSHLAQVTSVSVIWVLLAWTVKFHVSFLWYFVILLWLVLFILVHKFSPFLIKTDLTQPTLLHPTLPNPNPGQASLSHSTHLHLHLHLNPSHEFWCYTVFTIRHLSLFKCKSLNTYTYILFHLYPYYFFYMSHFHNFITVCIVCLLFFLSSLK